MDKSLTVIGQGAVKVTGEVYAQFEACVHCGLCLPACPTYVETGDEADSPRGRIHLMKALVDGRVGGGDEKMSDVVFEHLDRCLVCRACETACPSGVKYHEAIEAVRPQVAQQVLGRSMRSGMLGWVVGHVLPHAGRAKAALGAARVARRIGLGAVVEKVAPGAGAMIAAESGEGSDEVKSFTPALGKHRGNVVLLRGCVGSVVPGSGGDGGVNRACVTVLTRNGFDVHVLASEPCCGALAAHANDPAGARRQAQAVVETLEKKAGGTGDYFVSPIAGCGAQLKALHAVLAGDAQWAARARAITARVRDISEFLIEVGITPPAGRIPRRVTYHDPCHLAHAQRITEAPRRLLAMIPGLEIFPLAESDLCCGAAGTYSMNQPAMAAALGRRKAAHTIATGAEDLVTANVGCALQIARHLRDAGKPMRVRHVVEMLAESYSRES